MRRINLLYLFVLPLIFILYWMNGDMTGESAFFYGFAENKDTELSHDRPVLVSRILVRPGETVKSGQLLMEVKQARLEQQIRETDIELERARLREQEDRRALRRRIEQLKTDRLLAVTELEGEIRTLQARITYERNLREGLSTLGPGRNGDSLLTAREYELQEVQEEQRLVTEPIDLEIRQLESELAELNTSVAMRRKRLESEREFFSGEQENLKILAPSEGIIGNIMCKEGEYVEEFEPFIDFYARNPTMAKGFVHESLIPEVQIGDQLEVSSTLHPNRHIKGEVIGLGTRIVEIPERLRKIPDFKTYGREVLISIPSNNDFLQKEKIIFNSPDGVTTGGGLLRF
ncbi:hypothetical protein CEQ90_16035 [Lewinellaceae bacterium SD302]|nr:hypothetical protein CEQ90_16035 [Lewinellaceae bacterium SD302]